MGTLDQAHNLQARGSEAEGNAVQVKVELQADCYAGVWAANAKTPEGQSVMEQGDFEEGMQPPKRSATTPCRRRRRAGWCPTASPTAPRRSGWKRFSAASRAATPTPASFRAAHQHLARIRAGEQAAEGVRHRFQAVDDRLARLSLPARQPLAHVAVELGHAREIIEEMKPWMRMRAEMIRARSGGCRFARIVALDHPADGEAGVVSRDRQRRIQLVAADIVEIDVDAVGGGRGQLLRTGPAL